MYEVSSGIVYVVLLFLLCVVDSPHIYACVMTAM